MIEQATQPAAAETMADALESAFDEAGIRAEVEATDVGHIARTDDERTLMRYLRRRQQLEMEITHIKEQTAALLRSLESRLKGIDYVYERQAEHPDKGDGIHTYCDLCKGLGNVDLNG